MPPFCNIKENKWIYTSLLVCQTTSKLINIQHGTEIGSDDLQELLRKIGIPADSARTYAETFVEESITMDSLSMIDQEIFKELGVPTTHNFYHGVGEVYVASDASRLLGIWWCIHPWIQWSYKRYCQENQIGQWYLALRHQHQRGIQSYLWFSNEMCTKWDCTQQGQISVL